MKLASIWFDDVVTIALGKSNGEGEPRQNLQETSFHEADGWDITLLGGPSGVHFALRCEGMPGPVFIGGYGHTYVTAEDSLGDSSVAEHPVVNRAVGSSILPPPAKRRR